VNTMMNICVSYQEMSISQEKPYTMNVVSGILVEYLLFFECISIYTGPFSITSLLINE
jgi:hypothetical protein